ncbi:WYL domain-containing protein [Chryseobacterium oryzae]|uniref:WYL domain-containing protein n=1 Tax=Chryseobacterium oryzae TaxID=2929799 RepID=A0ABY4BKJ2_9FLAO|nr:WYL domain-containing protein [Chryseobacterium oryzae]UOE39717.1 WYL domain-containing protein [Chryseobacterium oryzae]
MAKRQETLLRLTYIVNFLKSKKDGADYFEIAKHLEERAYREGEGQLPFSEKTFQRDRKVIEEFYNVIIQFKNSNKKYHIVDTDSDETNSTLLYSIILINAYKQIGNRQDVIIFEKRQASGLYNFDGFVHAIHNLKKISFEYVRHWEKTGNRKVVEPYALKEFRNRWYLLAVDTQKSNFELRIFGLDRITNLEIHNSQFRKQEFDIEKMFVNSFGIVSTLNIEPTIIELSFETAQRKFVKSLPIHHSQEVLVDNGSDFKIQLQLVPTYDFYQELATHAERLIKIDPPKVRDEYLNFLKKGIENLL